ncbi:MAG: histidinol-phosphate transaminase [Pirellulaceae bacterium]|nr:histidinol-phosphate transaminase [Planctomycetales bacterium]
MQQYVRKNIQEMTGYTPGEQPQAGKFVKLNTNENPYPPSPAVGRAIREVLERGLSRYPDPTATAFRIRAAEVLAVEPDWILCGNGSDDILTIVTRAFIAEGQTLRSAYPSYILYRTLAEIQGATFESMPFHPDWSLPASFADMRDDVRLAVLVNPNSPSGTMVPPDVVATLAARLNCPLLVDEAYADFADTNCLPIVRQHPNVMVVRTMSKSYALAGLRFGFLVAQPTVIQQLLKVKDSYNCDALSIAGATAAIDDQPWLQDNRSKILATRDRLTESLQSMGFAVQPSQANFVWCQHADQPSRPLYEALKAQRVLVRYMDYPDWGDGLRITVGTDEQTDALLAILQSILK